MFGGVCEARDGYFWWVWVWVCVYGVCVFVCGGGGGRKGGGGRGLSSYMQNVCVYHGYSVYVFSCIFCVCVTALVGVCLCFFTQ